MGPTDEIINYIQYENIRSLESRHRCMFQVYNISDRSVDVIWVDYNGEESKYVTLKPRTTFVLNTFATHPWIFRDSIRKNFLKADISYMKKSDYVRNMMFDRANMKWIASSRVFFPPVISDIYLLFLQIRKDLYSLRELCFQSLTDQNVSTDKLVDLPKTILEEFSQYRNGLNISQIGSL
ncbi:hypothetical protein RDWZM_002587 [Blomia tropicalis]|uniref:von Hippel-Lindau disease tumour suppressor beta domain-containing protein n=1 Tax=Blomia tropicalis TaxID=40697 RepID=A0A9Q0MGL7_BLOTA|nr:hypothetical protein RDWZM_002587 [Blomia tropicalis]